jgi:hypothetical protein
VRSFFVALLLFANSILYAQEAGNGAMNSPNSTDSLPPAIGKSKAGIALNNDTTKPPILQKQEINWEKFAISTGVMAASITGLHILQYNSWWALDTTNSDGEGGSRPGRRAFHIADDPDYEHNFDKFGHFFGGYYTSHFFQEAFFWSGFDSSQSVLIGGICGALYELYVEIEDGFARDWGFSPGDAKADLAGAGFFILRNRIDFLRNFQYKWFYYPSGETPYIKDQTINPLDDYGGQSYWLTADIHRMLPESAKQYWPKWLNIAVGTSRMFVTRDSTSTDFYNQRKTAYYIGLDFDLEKLIPESDIGIINFIRRGLSYWRFPAPAFRISPDPRFFILFPFRMSIG